VGIDVPHPGVDKTRDERDKKHVKYYQWVGFCLFFQAILFYVPRWLWKNWEAGKIHALMMDLDIGVVQDVEKRQKKRLLLDYLADNLKHHNWWPTDTFSVNSWPWSTLSAKCFSWTDFSTGPFLLLV